MTEKIILEKRHNGVAILTFNRPEALNALDHEAMRSFADHIAGLHSDPDLRALILTGAGDRAFCSGGDLVELSEYPSEQDALDFITLMGDALRMMEQIPVPVIAALNGYALGGGSEIALACDLRIGDAEVRMGMVQVHLALTPGWGAGQRLLRLVGYPAAIDILLNGKVLHAAQLLEMGLLTRVVEPGQALIRAITYADHIATLPPAPVRGIKSLLRAGLEQSYDDALQTERAIFPALWAAEPHLDAVRAFLNRTKANNSTED